MKKKAVLEMEIDEPDNKEKYWKEGLWITGKTSEMCKISYFIGDVYDAGEKIARVAVTNDEYGIYDLNEGKWKIGFPNYLEINNRYINWESLHCNSETKEKIKEITKSKGNSGIALEDKMIELFQKKQQKKADVEKNKYEEDMDLTPEIPEEFTEWTKSLFESCENILFYKRTGNWATVKCGVCGHESGFKTGNWGEFGTEEPPRADTRGICRHCYATGIYKQSGRKREDKYIKTAYLFQNTEDDGIIIRMFNVGRCQSQGYKEEYAVREDMRAYLNRFKVRQYYRHNSYRGEYWSTSNTTGAFGSGGMHFTHGKVYGGYESQIRNSNYFRYCEIGAYYSLFGFGEPSITDVIRIMKAYSAMPQIELMQKMGLLKLTKRAILWEGVIGQLNKRAKDAAGFLKINKNRMKGLGDISPEELAILQYEKKHKLKLQDDDIGTIKELGSYGWEEKLDFITRYMTLKKALNRICEYAKKEKERPQDIIREYCDYLEIRVEMQYDMTNEVYLHPRNLMKKHRELIKEREKLRNEKHIQQMMEKYPKIKNRYKSLCKKYEYADEEYYIRPAKDAGEIVMEGRTLHHCVGGESYLSSHNNGTTTILFLRKVEAKDTPYITIEIKDNNIVQWYGFDDKKPNKEEIGKWLNKYIEQLKAGRKAEKKEERLAVAV